MNLIEKYLDISKLRILLLFSSLLFLFVYLFQQFSEKITFMKSTSFSFSFEVVYYILLFFILMKINWILESLKWQTLLAISNIQISFEKALRSVLAGVMIGFYTPGRLGEIPGRILFLDIKEKKKTLFPSFVSSFISSLITFVLGVFSLIFYLSYFPPAFLNEKNWIYILFLPLLVIIFYAFYKFLKSKSNYIQKLSLSNKDFQKAFLLGIFRYATFTFQYYLAFKIFGIDISFLQSVLVIPIIFLLVSFFPGFLLVQLGIRTSAAVFLVGFFDNNVNAILLSSLMVWSFNIILPSIVSIIWNGKKWINHQFSKA